MKVKVEVMFVEVVDRNSRYSYVIKVYEDVGSIINKSLPFKTRLMVWKHEVYFKTPIDIKGEANVYRIELGEVYYWPPEKALCLFYGISEPYTPVIHVGSLIGPLHYLRYVNDGDEAEVRLHREREEFMDLVKQLTNKGFDAASVLNGDVIALASSKNLGENIRLSFLIFKEEYGYHLETEPLFKFHDDYITLKTIKRIKNDIALRTKYLRLDVNEDDYVVFTVGVNSLEDLTEAIDELESLYPDFYTLIYQQKH